MEACKTPNEGIIPLRLVENAHRSAKPAQGLAMEAVPRTLFMLAIEALIKVDEARISEYERGTLYIRSFLFGTEAFLALWRLKAFTFCVIARPCGQHVKKGDEARTVWVTNKHLHAGPGGTGATKCGGDYAGNIVGMGENIARGPGELGFSHAVERKYLEALGRINIAVDDNSPTTPTLTTILLGIARESIITLTRGTGINAYKRQYSFDEWRDDLHSCNAKEAFACGIFPIRMIHHEGGDFIGRTGKRRSITQNLGDELVGSKHGKPSGLEGWRNFVRRDAEALTLPAPTSIQSSNKIIQQLGLLFVWTNVDPLHEADFSDWYHNEHFAKCVNIPGMRSATLYGNITKNSQRYLSLYYAENLDVFRSDAYESALLHQTPRSITNLARMRNPFRRVFKVHRVRGSGRGRGDYLVVVRRDKEASEASIAELDSLAEDFKTLNIGAVLISQVLVPDVGLSAPLH